MGECKCLDGWSGDKCNIKTCPNDCSGNGACILSSDSLMASCNCDDGFTGEDCSIDHHTNCPEDCNNNGICNNETGICHCNEGFRGTSCESNFSVENSAASSFKSNKNSLKPISSDHRFLNQGKDSLRKKN